MRRRMVVDFAIETLGVLRLEARAAVANGRGNGALRKLGAVQEGVLRRSFLKNGQFLDQVLWSILAEDWRQTKAVWGSGSFTDLQSSRRANRRTGSASWAGVRYSSSFCYA